MELDNRFHEILYNASDSKELKHVLLDFHHYVQRVRKITLADPKRSVQSNQEHRQIVEALKKHDAGLAEKLANEHMMIYFNRKGEHNGKNQNDNPTGRDGRR